MQRIENDCCGCAVPAYPCLGNTCPLRNAVHYYCDKCKVEIGEDEIYDVGGQDYCEDCLKEEFKKGI